MPDTCAHVQQTPVHAIPAILLAACAYARPDPVVFPELESGINSSNDGDIPALGNQPNVGVTTCVEPVR